MVQQKEQTPEHTHVLVDLAFVVRGQEEWRTSSVWMLNHPFCTRAPTPAGHAGWGSRWRLLVTMCLPAHLVCIPSVQITSRYGTEANKAAVDFVVYAPDGTSVHREEAVSETEIAGVCCCLCVLLLVCAGPMGGAGRVTV